MSIYQEIILDHYKNPRNFGILENATKSLKLNNPLCGDEIEMQLIIKNEKIDKIKFSGKGCAISMASASILTQKAIQQDINSLRKWDKSIILDELGIELSPNRLKCALLPLEILQNLVNVK